MPQAEVFLYITLEEYFDRINGHFPPLRGNIISDEEQREFILASKNKDFNTLKRC